MSLSIAPVAQQKFTDDNNVPLAGGKLYFYVTGTSTPLAVYQDALGTTPYPQPIVLNAAGQPGAIYFASAAYKQYLTDANDVPIGPNGGYTDPVSATALAASAIGGVIFPFGGEQSSPISATSYPSGTAYTACHADTAWWSIDSGNLIGTFALQAQMLSVSGITVTCALVNLTDGTPDTPIATVSSTSTTGERQISSAIMFATPGSPKTYAIKTQVSSGTGFVWSVNIVRLT
jgi:hypothetical protein